MDERRSTASAVPDLLPWQAVLMVACVTAAGLLHQHPAALRPFVAAVHTAVVQEAQLAPDSARTQHPGNLLNTTLWLRH